MPNRSDVSAAPSESGRPSQARPSIRAKRQRFGRRITALPLAGLEKAALHQFMQQGANTAALFFRAGDDVVQSRAVAEGDVASGGVDRELSGEVMQERVRI